MKLSNKGFAISSIMYIILVLGVILMVITLALLGGRKLVLDKLKGEVISGIYEEVIIEPPNEEPLKICIAVTDENVTTGNIPSGSYLAGDEYICQVNDEESYHFFVVSTTLGEDNQVERVNLLLERNINSDGSLAEGVTDDNLESFTEKSYNGCKANDGVDQMASGPTNLYRFLEKATVDWSNIPTARYEYTDEGGQGYFIMDGAFYIRTGNHVYSANINVRLPMVKEISTFDKSKNNLWMYNYLEYNSNVTGDGLQNIEGMTGYWTLSSDGEECWARYASSAGKITYLNIEDETGVRPVIIIPIENMA